MREIALRYSHRALCLLPLIGCSYQTLMPLIATIILDHHLIVILIVTDLTRFLSLTFRWLVLRDGYATLFRLFSH
jgi:hypothetical protein